MLLRKETEAVWELKGLQDAPPIRNLKKKKIKQKRKKRNPQNQEQCCCTASESYCSGQLPICLCKPRLEDFGDLLVLGV